MGSFFEKYGLPRGGRPGGLFLYGGVFSMYSLIAALPILLCVILMVAFGWPAKRAMPLAYLAAASEAGFLWKMQGVRIAGGSCL